MAPLYPVRTPDGTCAVTRAAQPAAILRKLRLRDSLLAMELVNPCGIFQREDSPLAERKPLDEIKVIGLFSNLKNNATLFLDDVGEELKRKHPHLEFVKFSKYASMPADFDQKWLDRVHAVVAAFGD
jgi:hypothetical protein